mmetsp:Transcript_27061/g.63036  ORF Transcript_27061/g.63036 Transcript_27061/m.63036 type:complete len:523 (-) Transcript_27061:1237-2805(-)
MLTPVALDDGGPALPEHCRADVNEPAHLRQRAPVAVDLLDEDHLLLQLTHPPTHEEAPGSCLREDRPLASNLVPEHGADHAAAMDTLDLRSGVVDSCKPVVDHPPREDAPDPLLNALRREKAAPRLLKLLPGGLSLAPSDLRPGHPAPEIPLQERGRHLPAPNVLHGGFPMHSAAVAAPAALDLNCRPGLLLLLDGVSPEPNSAHASASVSLNNDDLLLGPLEISLKLEVLVPGLNAQPHLAEECRSCFHFFQPLVPHDVHIPPRLLSAVHGLELGRRVIFKLRLSGLCIACEGYRPALPTTVQPLQVDRCFVQHSLLLIHLALLSDALLGQPRSAESLDANDLAHLEAVEALVAAPRQKAPCQALHGRGCLVEGFHPLPCEDADHSLLDGHGSSVLSHGAADQNTPGDLLDVRDHFVQLHPPHVVGAPVGLDHGGTNPGHRDPFCVVLKVLVPIPPSDLDDACCGILLVSACGLATVREPQPIFHHLVAEGRGVKNTRAAHHLGRARRTLHRPVRAKVVWS